MLHAFSVRFYKLISWWKLARIQPSIARIYFPTSITYKSLRMQSNAKILTMSMRLKMLTPGTALASSIIASIKKNFVKIIVLVWTLEYWSKNKLIRISTMLKTEIVQWTLSTKISYKPYYPSKKELLTILTGLLV